MANTLYYGNNLQVMLEADRRDSSGEHVGGRIFGDLANSAFCRS
jgi:hypothetical protein